jgi:hypothetical protein
MKVGGPEHARLREALTNMFLLVSAHSREAGRAGETTKMNASAWADQAVEAMIQLGCPACPLCRPKKEKAE